MRNSSRGGATPPPLSVVGTLARLALIGLVVLCAAGAFAYAGGWFSPHRLTQDRMLAALEGGASHPGFRRNHAKGLCVTGWFDSNGQAVSFSKASVFAAGRVPVVGRLALAGSMPFQPDAPSTVRSLALRFLPPGGEEWRTGMINIPVFLVNSPEGFYDLLVASKPDPATGKPDGDKMKAFFGKHPEMLPALAIVKAAPVSSGFGDATYNGLNAFRFINAQGLSTPVRWSVVPMQAVVPQTAMQAATTDKNYLFDDAIAQLGKHALQWKLMVTVGQAGDPTADPTLPWPPDRQKIDAGTITLNQVSSEDGGPCTDVNYDPLVLPAGIAPSDDPILSARSAAYARSFTLRAGEKSEKPPSAVTPQDVQSGEKS